MEEISDCTVVWRYMSFEKYVSMLISKSLYLSRVDTQLDKYEGFFPSSVVVHSDQRKVIENLKKTTYVNCWHMNKTESAAMWKLYSETKMSVSIKSTYGLLHNSIPNYCYIETVKYYENIKDLVTKHPIDLFLRKRVSFEHEKELRLIYQKSPFELVDTDYEGSPVFKIKELDTDTESGMVIDIDLNSVITDVYVSPESPSWFYDLVVNTNQNFGISSQVTKSTLYNHPYI